MPAIPEQFRDLERMSHTDLEKELLPFQNSFPEDLDDEQLARICVIHRLLARTTSGPSKKVAANQYKAMSVDDIIDSF